MCKNFCFVLASLTLVVVVVGASEGDRHSVIKKSSGRQFLERGSVDDLEDGEDDLEGEFDASGDSKESDCIKFRNKMRKQKIPGAYMPQCTHAGDFNPVQCVDEKGVRECFCIDVAGRRIPGTQALHPNSPNCTKLDRNKFLMAVVQKTASFSLPVAMTTTRAIGREMLTTAVSGRQSQKTSCPRCQRLSTPASLASDLDAGQLSSRKTLDADQVQGTSAQGRKSTSSSDGWVYVKTRPTLLAGIIGGVAVALMCIVLLLLFIVYRLRKKDEGSYALDEPKNSPAVAYTKANDREFFA